MKISQLHYEPNNFRKQYPKNPKHIESIKKKKKKNPNISTVKFIDGILTR